MRELAQDLQVTVLSYGVLTLSVLPLLWLLPVWRRRTPQPMLTTSETIALVMLAIFLPPLSISLMLDPALPDSHPLQRGAGAIVALLLWTLLFLLWQRPTLAGLGGDIRAGILAFIVLTPITYVVLVIITALMLFFEQPIDQHPSAVPPRSMPELLALLGSVCLAAPILEEVAFRGLLLPWARRRNWRPVALFATALTILFAFKGIDHRGVILFVIDLSTLMILAIFGKEIWKKWPTRSATAIIATAALFAALHAGVWPTPIPLAVLGLGLGLLTVRTGSVTPAIVCHSLFNAVSVIQLSSSRSH